MDSREDSDAVLKSFQLARQYSCVFIFVVIYNNTYTYASTTHIHMQLQCNTHSIIGARIVINRSRMLTAFWGCPNLIQFSHFRLKHTFYYLLHIVAHRCHPTLCENGGTCSNVGTADFSCQCPTGWTGMFCEIGEYHCIIHGPHLMPS